MIIGIVGAEAIKFTPIGEARAKALIHKILSEKGVTGVCSGGCYLGGIDIWAEEIGKALGLKPFIFTPKQLNWANGYKPRNELIGHTSDKVHCITVDALPSDYKGMRFDFCYHCGTKDHVKSGGCWTAKYAQRLGKPAFWHVIPNATPTFLSSNNLTT
jgi:hypothetical protein